MSKGVQFDFLLAIIFGLALIAMLVLEARAARNSAIPIDQLGTSRRRPSCSLLQDGTPDSVSMKNLRPRS